MAGLPGKKGEVTGSEKPIVYPPHSTEIGEVKASLEDFQLLLRQKYCFRERLAKKERPGEALWLLIKLCRSFLGILKQNSIK